jgi:hypothetical protein
MFEFDAKAFLIYRLVEPAALIFVNFKAGANNGVALVLKD